MTPPHPAGHEVIGVELSAEAVAAFCGALDALVTVRPVAGVDHAASILTTTGARATAELIAEAQS